jgi:glucosylceramidase
MGNVKITDVFNQLFFVSAVCLFTLISCGKGRADDTLTTDNEIDTQAETTGSEVEFWMTRGNKSVLFEKQDSLSWQATEDGLVTIKVDSTQVYQEMDGFGFALTGGSATVINQMAEQKKSELLQELFLTTGNSIGVSYIRISLGASDLSSEPFTYDETPNGEPDLNLDYFSLEIEQEDLLPILKQIIQLNPEIKILASPWTPPIWMKTNKSFIGGELNKEYYDVYARYFVKYIESMAEEGITIEAITVQNEPLHDGNNPSMYMSAEDQADFIKTALGPRFEESNINTKIIIYDHNLDRIDYPITVLNDSEAYNYIDGSAFHLYAGEISSMSTLKAQFPDKNLYFTEQWTGSNGDFGGDLKWHVSTLIIGATRNWSNNVLEWNLASDPNFNPHTDGGCSMCQGALTITGDSFTRNVSYYIIAHASKFVRPGSIRIASDTSDELQTVAFISSEGKKVLIVLNNETSISTKFNIQYKGKNFTSSLWSGAVGTYIWD